jgi:hypothetical protein
MKLIFTRGKRLAVHFSKVKIFSTYGKSTNIQFPPKARKETFFHRALELEKSKKITTILSQSIKGSQPHI